MVEPIWVRDDVVLAIHNRQIAEHGGGSGVRDSGLLSSALNRPKNLFHYSEGQTGLESYAAAYAFGITSNHPFVDGNKRTAFVVSLLFLALNDCVIVANQAEKYQIYLELASGRLTESGLAHWLKSNMREKSQGTL